MRPHDTKTYFVILRWDRDRPGVYVGHHFSRWRLWFGFRPYAKFKRIDMDDPEVHRFFNEEGAQMCCDMPDLRRQKQFLSICERRK